jgi:hypothetical protein
LIKKTKQNIILVIKILGLLFLLFGLIKTYLYFNNKDQVLIYCDFEEYTADGNNLAYSTNSIFHKIVTAAKNSTEYAHSGNNSIKIEQSEFANLIRIKNVGPDEVYRVTIYRKSGSAGIVIQEDIGEQTKIYKFQKFAIDTSENGWEKLEVQLRTPPNYSENDLLVYIWNPKKTISYFDDLKVEQTEFMVYPEFEDQVSLNIFIEDNEFEKLKKIRKEAFLKGVLITSDDSYINAIIAQDGKMIQAEIRFKGDWLDHLEGDKWSFRIKLKDDSWNGMCTFSIHTPFSRSFLNEWFIHKILLDNDVLATKYGFIPVKINNRSMGIYAYEEHFEKQILESNMRREGPILVLSEDDLWNRRTIALHNNDLFSYSAAQIQAFGQNRILKDPILLAKFTIAQDLLQSYRDGHLAASEVFDLKKFADYFAILTNFGGYHGMIWHNIRFYYNPVTCKIEPIGYDCYATYGINTWGLPDIACNFTPNFDATLPMVSCFYLDFITDTSFINLYIKSLKNFTSTNTVDAYLQKYQVEAKKYEMQIKHEFLNYKFETSQFYTQTNKIEKQLNTFINNVSRASYQDSIMKRSRITKESKNTDDTKTFANDYVKYYKNSATRVKIMVFHSYNLKIIGFGNKEKITQNSSYNIQNINDSNTYSTEININSKEAECKYVYYKIAIFDTIYKQKIAPWSAPKNYNPRTDMAENSTDISQYTNLNTREIHFTGDISFPNHVYTPTGYKVVFEAGTNIDITNNAAFIINSSVQMMGTKENPINIFSSDKSANGFTVLQADEKSFVNYTNFDNLNTLDYNNWTLTGAVNFYESDVAFNNCNFTNNHCEDMLNTIRCDFLVNNCLIENTFGDSHDSDFCTGTLEDCIFKNNGNDAIDFSTSEVTIKNCTIDGAEDKGISVGENTQVKIFNVTISNVNIGVASKDLSHAEINGCKINKATYGFVILQKKPEYGPASITAKNCELNEIWTESLIERHSTLILNGKTYNGEKQKLKALFYE